jgi:hypothetical protein
MKTNDFNQTISSSTLNENMFKKFGVRVNFNDYSREQLEDARNQLRTKLSQTETDSKFNDLLANEDYQQDKYMLNLLNTKIKEMLGERKLTKAEKAKKEKVIKKDLKPKKKEFTKRYGKDKGEQVMYAVATNIAKGKKMNKKTNEAKKAKPDYLDFDGDGDKKEPMKKALKDKKKAPPFMKKKKSSNVKESETNEMYHYDTKKGGRSVPPSDKLGRRPKGGVAKYGDEYKSMRTGTTASGKPFPAHLKKHYELNGPKGKLPEEMSEAAKPKCCCKTKSKSKCPVHGKKAVKETRRMYYNMIIEGLKRYIAEDEEAKAENIADAADMVEDFTGWMQKVGQYQTKTMLELSDEIRKNFGQAESEAFKNAVTPVLQQTLEVLTQSREAISKAVATLATGEAPTPMGMGGDMGMGIGGDMGMAGEMPPAAPDSMNMGAGDEFAASDAAAGGAETAGREMRESREVRRLRKIAESNRLMSRLSR